MSAEPQHQELWDALQKASDALEACACTDHEGECPFWRAYVQAKAAYVEAKVDAL